MPFTTTMRGKEKKNPRIDLTIVILDEDKETGTIIPDTKLPKKIHPYFWEIKECFLLGLIYPSVGLCRVLIELAFKDRFRAFESTPSLVYD